MSSLNTLTITNTLTTTSTIINTNLGCGETTGIWAKTGKKVSGKWEMFPIYQFGGALPVEHPRCHSDLLQLPPGSGIWPRRKRGAEWCAGTLEIQDQCQSTHDRGWGCFNSQYSSAYTRILKGKIVKVIKY